MPTLTTETINALAFAAHTHRDQRRKDAQASPYDHSMALLRVLGELHFKRLAA